MFRTEWLDYMKRRVLVTIVRRHIMERPVWAVTVDDDPEFWLDAFEDRADATRFCRESRLPHRMGAPE